MRQLNCPWIFCGKPLPREMVEFTKNEIIIEGKNKKCPHCHAIIWIPVTGEPTFVSTPPENPEDQQSPLPDFMTMNDMVPLRRKAN